PPLRGRFLQDHAPAGLETEHSVRAGHRQHGEVVRRPRVLVAADQAGRVPGLLRAHVRPAQGAQRGQSVRRFWRPALLALLAVTLTIPSASAQDRRERDAVIGEEEPEIPKPDEKTPTLDPRMTLPRSTQIVQAGAVDAQRY